MLFWIIQVTFLSIIFIFVLHSLIHFFKTTLTVPKIKDLIRKPTEQYKAIYETEEKSLDKENMKSELKDYLKNLSKTSTSTKLENVGDVFSENTNNTFTSY